MVNSIKILLHNNPNAVYYSDDVITGEIDWVKNQGFSIKILMSYS